VVVDQYDAVCAAVGVTEFAKDLLWQRAVANPSVFYPLD
jgi:hypothetical protein